MARGIDDLDFFIGDEALDATGYSVKVIVFVAVTDAIQLFFSIPYDMESSRTGI